MYVRNFYDEDWANNFMRHITVDDARGWWEHASRVIWEGGYGAARVQEPQEQSYGALVSFVWEPSGCCCNLRIVSDEGWYAHPS